MTACKVLVTGRVAGMMAAQGFFIRALCIRKAILEGRGDCNFPTAAEDSQTRQLSREQSQKDRKRTRMHSLQHCRQSRRLLKIAGNRHTAGSQRQKAGRFPREQPQKPTGSSFLWYTKLLCILDFSRKKEKKDKERISPKVLKEMVQRNYSRIKLKIKRAVSPCWS